MKTRLITAFLILISFGAQAQLTEQERFDTSKNLDIYNSIFTELVQNYVDSIDIEKTTLNNINYMLRRLDPYTEYYPEEDMQDFNFMTTGEYGGIGSVISMQDNKIIVREPYLGMPAALAGLRPGDQLLEIDGNPLEGQTTEYASGLLRGQPNTTVKIKYLRPGESKDKTITVERKRIHVDPITYYGVLEDSIGYINLSSFTSDCSHEFKTVLLSLITEHNIRSLVIDLRDNGGGIVEECLSILNFFLPQGELLLTMKGRTPQSERIYRASQEPIDTLIPLSILVNYNSASASEIVAGAIQDYDRGTIVGTRTYGKGLVQGTSPLPYEGRLKLTTAKYYIPSGRCIQAIDYAQRDRDGRVNHIPDSLTTVFYTQSGRPVRDGAGVLPDSIVEEGNAPTILYYLEGRQVFFDFVVKWRVNHPEIASPEEFILTDDIYTQFKEYATSIDFTYDQGSEKAMESLKRIMELEGYWDVASEQYTALEQLLKPDLERDLDLHREIISKYLAYEIMRQYYYQRGMAIFSLRDDIQLNKAISVLHGQ